MRNKILRPANAKYHYSYLFFHKISKEDLPLMYSCVFWCKFIDLVGFFCCYCLSSSSGVIKFVAPKCQTAAYQKSYIIRCIRVWNVVADELNLRMNALNHFKQAVVEYNKTALSNYTTVKIPTLLNLSVLNAISVVVLPSLSRVVFNFVIMYSETSIKRTPN